MAMNGPLKTGKWRLEQGWLEDLPRIARVYLSRHRSGTLPARMVDIRFWEMRACGWNPWDDSTLWYDRSRDLAGLGLWEWWCTLHPDTRRWLRMATRDYGFNGAGRPTAIPRMQRSSDEAKKAWRRGWMPSRRQIEQMRAYVGASAGATGAAMRRTSFSSPESATV